MPFNHEDAQKLYYTPEYIFSQIKLLRSHTFKKIYDMVCNVYQKALIKTFHIIFFTTQ